MLISEKTTGSIWSFFFFFFASKEAYPIVRQLEKKTVKKAQAKVVKCAKNKSCMGPYGGSPLGHLSVKSPFLSPPNEFGDRTMIWAPSPCVEL